MRVKDSIRRQMIACAVCVLPVAAAACDENTEDVVNPLASSSMVTATIAEVPSQLPVEAPAFVNFGCLATSLTYAPRPHTRRFDLVITALTPVEVDSVTIQMLDGTSLGGPMLTFPRPKLTERFGDPVYRRVDTPATPEQKAALGALSESDVTATELAGEAITAILTTAPGNGAPIGGLKVTTDAGWFAARPSGTENVAKVYAESFRGEAHLERLLAEAQALVSEVTSGA